MKDKFIKKYMRRAKAVAEDQNPCLSRAIGAVIIDPITNVTVSDGYNGPAKDVPHPDTFSFLSEYVYPQLTKEDIINIQSNPIANKFLVKAELKDAEKERRPYKHGEIINCSRQVHNQEAFGKAFEGCKICPRKLIGAISGARLELCACCHGERNAIANAAKAGHKTFGCYIFCWCGIPCLDCCVSIINAGITKVYCLSAEARQLEKNAYNFDNSRWQFKKSGVELIELDRDWILKDES